MFSESHLRAALRDKFGHADFRPGQLAVLREVLAGRPILAVMPTGAGKSLCYQLPSLLLEGVTLVVSPLVALMKDQVDALRARGIAAGCVNSSQTEREREAVEAALAEGRLRLVYVAPERFRSTAFRRALDRVPLALVAVDEAHCISEWGHSFRPDYERLGETIDALRPPRLLALTATASPDVRADILRALRFRDGKVEVAGFDRPNLHLEVHATAKESEKQDSLLAALREHSPAIVYTATRKKAEDTAKALQRRGITAAAYHGGLEPEARERAQDGFAAGTLPVVVATNAFGLGVDKADVRLVVHRELPRSLEAYYQEVGRAGRDGKPAIGALFFAPQDVYLQKALLQLASPRPQAVLDIWEALGRAERPLTRDELRKAVKGPRSHELFASLAFLEGLGIVDRQFRPASIRLHLLGKPDPRGETTAGALARILNGMRGTTTEDTLLAALGHNTRHALHGELDRLEQAGVLRRHQAAPAATYLRKPGQVLAEENLRRLRIRLSRDRGRLEQVIELGRRRDCRRRTLLKALGESYGNANCGACDVCVGPRIVAVHSRLAAARGQTEAPLFRGHA